VGGELFEKKRPSIQRKLDFEGKRGEKEKIWEAMRSVGNERAGSG